MVDTPNYLGQLQEKMLLGSLKEQIFLQFCFAM